MTARSARTRFFQLLRGYCAPHVFNPWCEHNADERAADNGPAMRCRRLRRHLDVDAKWLLIGEAAGYQGCRITGIAFTSERLVMAGSVPRLESQPSRLSTRPRPWSEPSATVVWSALCDLKADRQAVLWNAFAWHPHRPGEPHSNRTPTQAERAHGLAVLDRLLAQFPRAQVFALGRHAEQALQELGRRAQRLRHPSMGGAMIFRRELSSALR